MAISFEKLISDVQGYGDATEIPITIGTGDTATTERLRLGDIRGQLSNTLARYEAALQSEREQRSTLEQTLKSLKDATTAAQTGDRGAHAAPGAPTDDDLNADPWSKTLRNSIRSEFDERLKAAVADMQKQHGEFADLSKKGVGALTQLLLNLKASQDFKGLEGWPKDYDSTRAFKEAGDRGYIDKATGLPDLSRLHHEVTEDQRGKALAEKLAEKMIAERDQAAAEKNQGRFSKLGVPGGIRSKAEKQQRQYKTLQDYMMSNDALPTDDEMRAAGGLLNVIR